MNDAELELLTMPRSERRVLLLGDVWSRSRDGIAAVNRSLALSLARFKGAKIYSTILGSFDSVQATDRCENVQLIPSIAGEIKNLYKQLDSNPIAVFPDITAKAPKVSFIIGHAPVTAKAALEIRDTYYPKAKVILFYHVIPGDVEWLEDSLPYPLPEDNALVTMAERSDVVYSVTDRCHWYFTAKFRNRAQKAIDHRKFYPQCSEQVFAIKRVTMTEQAARNTKSVSVLALCDGGEAETWLGVDIAVCAASKLIPKLREHGVELSCLKIANLSQAATEKAKKKVPEMQSSCNGLRIVVHSYASQEEMRRDLEQFSICLIPTRCEPFGAVGLAALSAGIPTLVAQDSGTASLIARLTSEPEFFTVPVTPNTEAYRQDGSAWCERALTLLLQPVTADERARQLRTALKRDETTKQTHDSVATFCLGGIALLFDAVDPAMLTIEDEEKEVLKMCEFNSFLTKILKQCWRLKHHPLTQETDLFQLLPGVSLPINELLTEVTDRIEQMDRRIVGLNETSGAFIVYCPSPVALQDLWAQCDVVGDVFTKILFRGNQPNPVMRAFGFEFVKLRTSIEGPEFLAYKKELLMNML